MIRPRRKQVRFRKIAALVKPTDEMYNHLIQQLRAHSINFRQRETYHGVTFYVREDHVCLAQTIHDALKFQIDPFRGLPQRCCEHGHPVDEEPSTK
jgi:hypothetical protein